VYRQAAPGTPLASKEIGTLSVNMKDEDALKE
jgi:hypothetical protein